MQLRAPFGLAQPKSRRARCGARVDPAYCPEAQQHDRFVQEKAIRDPPPPMNVTFLFNSRLSIRRWLLLLPPIMRLILASGVLQASNRHMRVSTGDVLTYSAAARSPTPTRTFLVELCKRVYQPSELDMLLRVRLEATYAHATVYCWLFHNMTERIASDLHAKLIAEPAYLGAMDVNLANPLHLALFRIRSRRTSDCKDLGVPSSTRWARTKIQTAPSAKSSSSTDSLSRTRMREHGALYSTTMTPSSTRNESKILRQHLQSWVA